MRALGRAHCTLQTAHERSPATLLLTRKLGENIRIGDDIKVTIVEVKGSHVKLGIEAPPTVKVHREEIYERIQKENGKNAHVADECQPPSTALPGDDHGASGNQ